MIILSIYRHMTEIKKIKYSTQKNNGNHIAWFPLFFQKILTTEVQRGKVLANKPMRKSEYLQ